MSDTHNNNHQHVNYTNKLILQRQPASRIDQLLSWINYSNFMSSKDVVSVIPLNGVIASKAVGMKSTLSFSALNPMIEKAFSFKNLVAVCILVNSPGGSPVQSELIASRIIQLSTEKNIPVYCFIEDIAASGGYWLACAAHEIFASKSSIVGSIGVIYSGFGLDKVIDRVGIERRVYTIGKNKSVLDPFLPAKDTDIKIVQNIQSNIFNHFVSYIKSRRGSRITQNDDIVFNGNFWSGDTALEYGLIDGIDNLYSFLSKKYGNAIKVEIVKSKEGWFKSKLGLEIEADRFIEKIVTKIKNQASLDKYDFM